MATSGIKSLEAMNRARDTGMAFVLLCLLAALSTGKRGFLVMGVALLVADMIAPIVFKPASRVWFGLSAVLGAIVPRILLAALYYVFVVPVGLARRMVGKDPMQTGKWKKGHFSVFVDRNHKYSSEDLDRPY